MSREKLPMEQADYLAMLYIELKALELTPREMIRILGLLMNAVCKYEGRGLTPEYLSNIFNHISATQMDHQLDKELDDLTVLSYLSTISEERQALNG